MNSYAKEYKKKLTTPERAVAGIKNGATIIPGMVGGEPAALLAAIADRARQGDLKDLSFYFLHPQVWVNYSFSTVHIKEIEVIIKQTIHGIADLIR